MKALVIAGTASGVGKTMVTAGLIAALARRGLRVQPFKVGPDYIDPSYHTSVAGRPCRNLDSWMLPRPALLELYARASADCDVAVVEGVMGLHDGRSGGGDRGSTAQVAKLIRAPVVLVIDAARTARSAAAIALGFRQLDPDVDVAGAIVNNVASPKHERSVADPIEREAGLPVLGTLRRNPAWRIQERYLGLVPTGERPLDARLVEDLATTLEERTDLDRMLEMSARATAPRPAHTPLFPAEPLAARTRIAVARDAAFSFYYEDNLDLLRAWGADVVPFSPLADDRLPSGTAGIYLGGGFPELFAADLARNDALLDDLRRAAAAGMPIYAECGGLMYLAEGLVDREGRRHRMAGLIPGWSSLERGRLTLGYREVRARRDSPLARRGDALRGHEFHWSVLDRAPVAESAAYDVLGDSRLEGYARGHVLASYVHLHFGSDPALTPRLIEACAAWAAATPFAGLQAGGHHPRSAGEWATASRPEEAPRGAGATNGTPARHPRVGPLLRAYGLRPEEIESLSERRILAASGEHLPADDAERALVARLVYAAGDPALASAMKISKGAIAAGVEAIRRAAPIVADVKMVAAGLSGPALARLGCELLVAVERPEAAALATALGITRSAAGVLACAERLDGAIVAIGNAPTALLALLDAISDRRARPALVIGLPVGFVAAVEAKHDLLSAGVPYVTLPGTRGGSPLAAAALNHLLRLAEDGTAPVTTGAQVDAPEQRRPACHPGRSEGSSPASRSFAEFILSEAKDSG